MPRSLVWMCCAAVLAVGASSVAADELIEKLHAIPGLVIVQEKPALGGRFFLLTYRQPVNHLKSRNDTFDQRVSLFHRADDRPMVLYSSGFRYSEDARVAETEVTRIVQGNQLNIEHRFFEPSRPAPADWRDLTIFQQASDDHRLVQAFRGLYSGRWLRAGVSKGGMQATYHARFYPRDMDGLIAYGASNDAIDNRDAYISFLDQVGNDPACRENLKVVQRQALLRRDEIVSMMVALTGPAGQTYHRIFGTPDKALELLVLKMPFVFWQFFPPEDCASVPRADASTREIFDFLDRVQGFFFWTDDSVLRSAPYFVQAGTQLGYPSVADDHVADLLRYPGADVPRSFVPSDIAMPPFQWWAMLDVDFHVRFLGHRQMFIYGELDPWRAERFRPGPHAVDSHVYIIPGANHRIRIDTMPPAEREAAITTVRRWAGLPPPTPADLAALRTARRHTPALDQVDRLIRGPR